MKKRKEWKKGVVQRRKEAGAKGEEGRGGRTRFKRGMEKGKIPLKG